MFIIDVLRANMSGKENNIPKVDPFRVKNELKAKKQKRSQGSSHYRPKAPTELTPLGSLKGKISIFII